MHNIKIEPGTEMIQNQVDKSQIKVTADDQKNAEVKTA